MNPLTIDGSKKFDKWLTIAIVIVIIFMVLSILPEPPIEPGYYVKGTHYSCQGQQAWEDYNQLGQERGLAAAIGVKGRELMIETGLCKPLIDAKVKVLETKNGNTVFMYNGKGWWTSQFNVEYRQ